MPRFGSGPVELVIPRRRTVILDLRDVGRVLSESPDPFDPATKEQRQALSKFQPHGVLISQGPIRTQPPQTNEAVLYIPADLHRVAEPFARVIADEAMLLLADPHTRAAWTRWWRLAPSGAR